MLIGISIAALILVFVVHSVTRFASIGREMIDKTAALYIAEDGMEIVRFIRDDSWTNISSLTNGATYYLNVSSTTLAITGTPETVGIFSRSFVVDEVERGATDDIVVSGVTDPGSKYVTVTVTWDGGTESVSLTSVLANIANP